VSVNIDNPEMRLTRARSGRLFSEAINKIPPSLCYKSTRSKRYADPKGAMIGQISAELVLIAHFSFVLYAVFVGFLLTLGNTWMWIHLPVVVWSSVVNLASWKTAFGGWLGTQVSRGVLWSTM
jgi:hypothetical protein